MPTLGSMNWRNRIVGGIAIALGLTIIILLEIEAHWDNHDTTKPLKALLGGLAFVGLGAWYLISGAKAEPWRETKNPLSLTTPSTNGGKDIISAITELEGLPSFQAECQKVEAEMREKAAEMENAFESELKDKA